jgi:chromosome segregation ATPase
MEEDIDQLVLDIETLSTEISQMNFKLEGLKEDIDDIEENRPFMVRQKALNERKLLKLVNTVEKKMLTKQDLETRLGAYQVAKAADSNPNPVKEEKSEANPNIEETPKE